MRSLLFVLSALATACATHAPPPAAPSYAPVATRPASPHAALYAACLADAVASQRIAHAEDADTSVLVFTCQGAPAQAFIDGLAEWSAREHSQFVHAGRTYRSTARVRHDLFGVDYCAVPLEQTVAAPPAECAISLNAGDFVRWTKQLLDLLGQVAEAAPRDSGLRETAGRAMDAMRRGVVAYSSVT